MKVRLLSFFAVALLALAGCDYDAPLTAKPTHAIEPKLLGDWVAVDPDEPKELVLGVRKLDDSTYIAVADADAYRAFHSDFAGLPLLSVQDLNTKVQKYVMYWWKLSDDGSKLTLRRVNTDVIPDSNKTTADLQQAVKASLSNPKLLDKELNFTRKKQVGGFQ